MDAKRFGRTEGLLQQVSDDRLLEAGNQVEGLGVAKSDRVPGFRIGDHGERLPTDFGGLPEVMGLHIAKDGGLDSTKGEERPWRGFGARSTCQLALRRGPHLELGLDLSEGEGDRLRIAVGRQSIDPWASGIGKAEDLGDFIKGLSSGVVDSPSDVLIAPDTQFGPVR